MKKLIFSLAMIVSFPSYAEVSVIFPISTRIIQCGKMENIVEACSKEPACCNFIEPSGEVPDTIESCELSNIEVEGNHYPVCTEVSE